MPELRALLTKFCLFYKILVRLKACRVTNQKAARHCARRFHDFTLPGSG